MCAIFGLIANGVKHDNVLYLASHLDRAVEAGYARGRDGRGYSVISSSGRIYTDKQVSRLSERTTFYPVIPSGKVTLIGNTRAEPTTEFVREKHQDDQQPYSAGMWSIVHNGTIANDTELRTRYVNTSIDSSAIVETLHHCEPTFDNFLAAVHKLKGSFAILAHHRALPGMMFVAANYRPVWYAKVRGGYVFASTRGSFGADATPVMLPPYTAALFDADDGILIEQSLYREKMGVKALVVCSGGLDSVVAAAAAQRLHGYDVTLIHFRYGSRAEGPEVEAVKKVGEYLKTPVVIFPLNVYDKKDSPLLNPDGGVAGGMEGAEFAHEWVPARNLLLLSVATAYAEANGFETIILGNNLEEAGAYPDNEPEFIARFNDLLPFAVADGKRMRVSMPVGNMMKHEIVALGLQVGAPLHLTWSCYRAGELHCGQCGPCYMRRTAFTINNVPEVINYAASLN